jgi:hypothetical protein
MSIKGLKPTSTKKYVLKDDPCRNPDGSPSEGATVFYIKTLDGYERAYIRDQAVTIETVMGDDGQPTIKVEDKPGLFKPAYQTLRIALQGWDNFQDDDGNQISFDTDTITLAPGMAPIRAPTWDCLRRIPSANAFELMAEIMGFNELTKAEASKSGAVSSLGKSTPNVSAVPATPPAESNGAATPDLPLIPHTPDRQIPRHDRDPLDRDQGVRRTLKGSGAVGSTLPPHPGSGMGG